MADSMLSDLPSASEINDTDLLYAVVEGVSKKITKQVLFNAVTQVLSTKADLVQGVLALAQTREMLTQVLNDTARFALTTSDVKNGFIIIVQQDEHGVPYSPNPKMYIVVDDTKLDEEDGYQPFASDVDWDTIENKPDNIVFSGPALATENVPAIDAYLHKSDVVDNFTDGGTDVPLSAECGKLLNSTLALLSEVSHLQIYRFWNSTTSFTFDVGFTPTGSDTGTYLFISRENIYLINISDNDNITITLLHGTNTASISMSGTVVTITTAGRLWGSSFIIGIHRYS